MNRKELRKAMHALAKSKITVAEQLDTIEKMYAEGVITNGQAWLCVDRVVRVDDE